MICSLLIDMSAAEDEASVSRATWTTETHWGILPTSFPWPAFSFLFFSFLCRNEVFAICFGIISFSLVLFFFLSSCYPRDPLLFAEIYPAIDHGYWYNLDTHADTRHHLCILPMYIPVPASETFKLSTGRPRPWSQYNRLVYIGQHGLHWVHLCTWPLHISGLSPFHFLFPPPPSRAACPRYPRTVPWSSCICPVHIT